MKRDLDLMKAILLELEESPSTNGWLELEIEGRMSEEVSEHVHLLAEAGLIEAYDASSSDGQDWKPVRLTNSGHDFLEYSRNDNAWNSSKRALSKVGTITLDLMKSAMIEFVKRQMQG
jgi:DNA-binding PadR family transcriptional regulator